MGNEKDSRIDVDDDDDVAVTHSVISLCLLRPHFCVSV